MAVHLYRLHHLTVWLCHMLVIKTFASHLRYQSTLSTMGENDARLNNCLCCFGLYFLFFSFSAYDNTAFIDCWACDWMLVLMTCISNNASAWGCHNPLNLWSATRARRFLASSASLMIGSILCLLYANAAISPRASLTSLCLWVTRPPLLQSMASACSILKEAPQPSQSAGSLKNGRLYHSTKASQNSVGDRS